MERQSIMRLGVWVLAVVLLAGTRLPAEDGLGTLLVGVVVFTLAALAAFTLWPKAPARARPLLFALSLVAMILPPAPGAWIAGVPAWMVALFYVGGLHVFFQDPGTKAPRVDTQKNAQSQLRRNAVRMLPAVALGITLIALPLAYPFLLPLRFHAAFELQTAFGPLFVLLLLGTLVAATGVLRAALSHLRPAGSGSTAPSPTPEVAEGVKA